MKFNVILFGCDNSGKTTLATELRDLFLDRGINSYITKSLGPVSAVEQVTFMAMKLFPPEESTESIEVQIFDRFPLIEERVCGEILRKENRLKKYEEFGRYCLSQINFLVLCDPGIDSILNWGSREQMVGVKENATKLWEEYKKIPLEFGVNSKTLYYDYNEMEFMDIGSPILYYVLSTYNNHKSNNNRSIEL